MLLEHLEGLFDDAIERHEAAANRLLAERHDGRLGAIQRPLGVDAAIQAVAGDVATDIDQPPPDGALLDDLDVVLEATEIRQVDVQAGEVRQAAGTLEGGLLLEFRLHGAQVDRDLVLLQLEHDAVDQPVALGVEVLRLEPPGDRGQQTRIEQHRRQHGALRFLALRHRFLGLEELEHEGTYPSRIGAEARGPGPTWAASPEPEAARPAGAASPGGIPYGSGTLLL